MWIKRFSKRQNPAIQTNAGIQMSLRPAPGKLREEDPEFDIILGTVMEPYLKANCGLEGWNRD